MIAELAEVLYRSPFSYTVDDMRAVLYEYRRLGTEVQITGELHAVDADPDDDKIVECAVVWGASYLVSRNHHLLDLGDYEGISMIRPADFLAILHSSGF